MAFNATQMTSFFEDANQTGLPNPTVQILILEGIATGGDLTEFQQDDLDNLARAIRRDPAGLQFRIKSQKLLSAAANLVRYYELVGRAHSAGNMRWD